MIGLCRRFALIDRSQRRVLVEAAALMALAWLGLRLVRFRKSKGIFDCVVALTVARAPVAPDESIEAVRRAIGAIAIRSRLASCLVQALAADAMLRRRRVASELRVGVRFTRQGARSGAIEGHAWVDCGGGATVGIADHQSDFGVLTAAVVARPR